MPTECLSLNCACGRKALETDTRVDIAQFLRERLAQGWVYLDPELIEIQTSSNGDVRVRIAARCPECIAVLRSACT